MVFRWTRPWTWFSRQSAADGGPTGGANHPAMGCVWSAVVPVCPGVTAPGCWFASVAEGGPVVLVVPSA